MPVDVSKGKGVVSLCCCYEEGERDCQHRAEPGCALHERFSSKGNPVVEDLASVLGRRARVVQETAKILIAANVSFVIGGRDAVNAYCPSVVEATLRTDFFIRSKDKDVAWKVLKKAGFGVRAIDPTCCVVVKREASVELHYGRPPHEPEYLDDETLARSIKVKLIDIDVPLQPMEELVAYKADRYSDRDKVDLKRLLSEWGGKINVERLREVARKRGLSLKNLSMTGYGIGLKR